MKLIILATLIILGSLLGGLSKKHTKSTEKARQDFWDKELAANNVRKKSLDDLSYVTIPLNTFPLGIMTEDEKVQEYIDTIQILSESKIVNFTGITNTDLKLEYGTANLTVLSQYDENFTTLIITIQKWAKRLYDNDFIYEAGILLEYAISVGSDIGATYYLLADIYRSRKDSDKIYALMNSASALNNKAGKAIARTLRESYL